MIAGDNDTSDKFIASVADTGDKLFTGDTSDNIFPKVSLIPVIKNQKAKMLSPVIKGSRNQSTNPVEMMPGVLKSLKIRAQALSRFTQTYVL
jgi:hypothetical protein